ncbi:MAG: hypothetical protein Q9215_000212, partial [Flavoplaca cf. flavocitrina]
QPVARDNAREARSPKPPPMHSMGDTILEGSQNHLTIREQEQNQLWAANRNGLHVFVDSEKSKAKQEIKEAGSETRASIQRSWDLELQRSRAMPHELLDLIEQATQDCEMYNSIAS